MKTLGPVLVALLLLVILAAAVWFGYNRFFGTGQAMEKQGFIVKENSVSNSNTNFTITEIVPNEIIVVQANNYNESCVAVGFDCTREYTSGLVAGIKRVREKYMIKNIVPLDTFASANGHLAASPTKSLIIMVQPIQ
jgi:hypothetical protein